MSKAQRPAQPGYWAVVPAPVRHDKGLRPNAKLIYAEITSLENAKGYCWAQNEYFAELFDLSKKTVSDLIGTLKDKGYIDMEVIRDPVTNKVMERRVWSLDLKPAAEEEMGISENKDTTNSKNEHTHESKNEGSPPPKNAAENNINSFEYIPPIVPQRGRRRREPKKAPDWKPDRFAGFWNYYPRGESKQAAIYAWDKLKPDDALIEQMGLALKAQMATEEWQRGIGVPYASTWLNQRRWEDVIAKSLRAPEDRPADAKVVQEETGVYLL